ncbi:MAG: KamA family radical SAM protein [Planctomycetaceae bacterium]|nr:KamA family radical SAM protein [Planctomycetaceae bacterium]
MGSDREYGGQETEFTVEDDEPPGSSGRQQSSDLDHHHQQTNIAPQRSRHWVQNELPFTFVTPGENTLETSCSESVATLETVPLATATLHSPALTAASSLSVTAVEPHRSVLPRRRRPPLNPRTRAFRRRFFPDITDQQWNDWRWQSQNRIRKPDQFERFLKLSEDEREALTRGGTLLPVGVTPYYMSLLDADDPLQPLRRTVVPTGNEFVRREGEADDPLGEDGHSPVPGLVHRYPDRVLLLPLDFCSTYCRYCTRSRVVGHGEIVPNEKRLEAIFQYLENTPQVRDVLISGGDPLALSDEKLDWILSRLRAIPHIEFVRIGTKMPAVLPQRITPAFVRMLRRYHPLWMSIHFLHPDECTAESRQACERLSDGGIPLGSQTVLLRGVNDSVETMKQLVHNLLLMRVRPYYLYQCDPISGSSHFRTPVQKGLEIIEGLRGHTTGYAVPTYVIDAPGGGGKIPLQPQYYQGRDGDWVVLRNFEGNEFRYPDPVEA